MCIIIDSFFCCYELKTGALFVARLGVICESIAIMSLLLASLVLANVSCDEIAKVVATYDKSVSAHDRLPSEKCEMYRTAILVGLIVSIVLLGGLFIVDYLLIKGTKKRNHILILPAVVCYPVVGLLLVVAQFMTLSIGGCTLAVLCGLWYGYVCACLYSLYVEVRHEKYRRAEYNAHISAHTFNFN